MKNTDQQHQQEITRVTSHHQAGTRDLAVKGFHVTVAIIPRGLASSQKDNQVDLGPVTDFWERQKAQVRITEVKVNLIWMRTAPSRVIINQQEQVWSTKMVLKIKEVYIEIVQEAGHSLLDQG